MCVCMGGHIYTQRHTHQEEAEKETDRQSDLELDIYSRLALYSEIRLPLSQVRRLKVCTTILGFFPYIFIKKGSVHSEPNVSGLTVGVSEAFTTVSTPSCLRFPSLGFHDVVRAALY